jgi:hypothetical protein
MGSNRKSQSNKPRIVLPDGRNVCAICNNPKKHLFIFGYQMYKKCMEVHHVTHTNDERASQIHEDNGERSVDVEMEGNIDESEFVKGRLDIEVDPDIKDYLNEHWTYYKSTLPTLNRFLKREGALDRRIWPTWKFVTPDPYVDDMVTPKHLQLSIGSVEVHVWCPHTFFYHYLSGFIVKCVDCGGSSNVKMHGWTGFQQLTGLTRSSFIISRRYRHVNCLTALKMGRSDSFFTALDDRYMKSLPAVVQAQMGFVIHKKICIYI